MSCQIYTDVLAFQNMLKKIDFTADDMLYIIGDIIDRGTKSIELVKYCMNQKNIILIRGNHEQMMLDAMKILNNKKDKTVSMDEKLAITYDWYRNVIYS